MDKYSDLISKIESLSAKELAELVKALEEKFGISAAAPVAAGAGAANAGAAAEEKTSFNVILKSGGEKKIDVIKAIREVVPTLGLKEAKDLVEGAPKPIKERVKKEEAEEIKKKVEAAGGQVAIE
jgi:large subunit ribosomal protein L7/L12